MRNMLIQRDSQNAGQRQVYGCQGDNGLSHRRSLSGLDSSSAISFQILLRNNTEAKAHHSSFLSLLTGLGVWTGKPMALQPSSKDQRRWAEFCSVASRSGDQERDLQD